MHQEMCDPTRDMCIRKCVCKIFPRTLRIFRPDPAAKCMQNGPSTEARVKESSWVKMKVIHFDFLLTSRLTHTLHVHQKMCLQNISPPRTLRISWNTARYNLFFFFFFFFFFFISIKAPHYICIRKCVIPHVTCASGNVFARYFPVPYAYSGQSLAAKCMQNGPSTEARVKESSWVKMKVIHFDFLLTSRLTAHVTCGIKKCVCKIFPPPVPYA